MTTTTETRIRTIGELKKILPSVRNAYVWCAWQRDDGDYIQVTKKALLRGIGADIAPPPHNDGRCDGSEFHGFVDEDGDLYVN